MASEWTSVVDANTVIGVDVSVRRGLDVVVLSGSRIVEARAQLCPDDVYELLHHWRPAAIAIDSPPGRGREPGSTRPCEAALRRLGVNIFSTPSDPQTFARPFFEWVRCGQKVFEAARRARYEPQEGRGDIEGRALEVFPHASDVLLRRCLPPPGTAKRVGSKRCWRLDTLDMAGVTELDRLCRNRVDKPTVDSIDAALAALTARRALDGDFTAFGTVGEWLVVPGRGHERLAPCG